MKNANTLAAAVVITLATALVVAFAFYDPVNAPLVLFVYIVTICFLSLLMYAVLGIYSKHKSSIDADDMVGISENLNTEMIIWNDDLSFIFMNKRMRELLGITDENFDKKEALKTAFGITGNEKEKLDSITESPTFEAQFTGKDGKLMSIAWSTSFVKRYKKRCTYLSTGFNLTDIKKMRVSLASANDFFNSSMELAEIGIIMSTDRKKFAASSETIRMFNLQGSSVDIATLRSLVHPHNLLQFDSACKSTEAETGEVRNIELRMRPLGSITSDASYRWYSFRYKAIKATGNTLALFGGAIMDINEEHAKDELIERLAYNDEITGISNRNRLMELGQDTYDYCRPLGYAYWVIVLDIDRFHIINDTCGYSNGNEILRAFAQILQKQVYKHPNFSGIAARISGDNFAIIIRDYAGESLPERTAKEIQEEFAKLAVDDFSTVNLSCSVGYSKMPDDGNSFLDVLEHSEFALKSNSGVSNSICAYEPSMHDSIIGQNELEKALAMAIENDELKLFYQPKINLKTGRIMGVEALIRWIKPDGTIITPNVFVPIAEKSGLISKISDYVLFEGCRQNKSWQDMGYPKIVMSINFTSSDFYQPDLKEKVNDALKRERLSAEWLEVELTETLALSDIDFAVSQMNKLRELGVKLAMDDFGTGYSSLSYLQILPITLLKLDRSFITDIQNDNIAFEIVSSVIRIAKSKKIETIAEGIENREHEGILREAGCDYGQGYLYGKPMPAEELEKLFAKFS